MLPPYNVVLQAAARNLGYGAVLLLGCALMVAGASPSGLVDVQMLFDQAEVEGWVGTAVKAQPVDARAARPGEIVVTVIANEGVETRSPPASPGDMVVRSRCPETGNEQLLVSAAKFPDRYVGPIGPADDEGWQAFRPQGKAMRYFVVPDTLGSFSFTAPWGEVMNARPGDAIVRDPADRADTYRIAAAAFACTYRVTRAPVKVR